MTNATAATITAGTPLCRARTWTLRPASLPTRLSHGRTVENTHDGRGVRGDVAATGSSSHDGLVWAKQITADIVQCEGLRGDNR
jgi:hypothetical protein